jgi:hypothetical protein
MNPDPASLDNLQDIYVPADVPWWPPAPGWWFVFAVLLSTLTWSAWHAWRRWHRNAYRRAALRELMNATSGAEIAELLKRTALCAYPRDEIASLTGDDWVQWLRTKGGPPVTDPIRDWLCSGIYGGRATGDLQAISDFAAGWIRGHETGGDPGAR